MPYLLTQLTTTQRIDIIWDEYIDNSLKTIYRKQEAIVPEDVCWSIHHFQQTGKRLRN